MRTVALSAGQGPFGKSAVGNHISDLNRAKSAKVAAYI